MTWIPHEPTVVSGEAPIKSRGADDTEWHTQVMKTYSAQCACGWRGPTRTRSHEADDDANEHRIYAED